MDPASRTGAKNADVRRSPDVGVNDRGQPYVRSPQRITHGRVAKPESVCVAGRAGTHDSHTDWGLHEASHP